jgi:hypothetical protein
MFNDLVLEYEKTYNEYKRSGEEWIKKIIIRY